MQVLFKPEEGIINDLDGGVNILPLTIKDDNTIIGWVDAIKLKAHVASETFKNSSPKYPEKKEKLEKLCLLYTSPSPRDRTRSRMPSSA